VFIQRDPIEFDSGTLNNYAYVGANPISLTDPSGLFAGPQDSKGTVTGSAGEWLKTVGAQTAARASAIGTVGGGTLMMAARITALLEAIVLSGDTPEESPDPTPAPASGGRGGGARDNHHCFPVSYGFDKAQKTMSRILRVDHQKLHRLMRKHFQEMENLWLDKISSLDYGPGRPNRMITAIVGRAKIEEALKKFYDKFPEFGC
jgi:hypothetical protein